jgi:SagB-type dehydrogenase family enzyme
MRNQDIQAAWRYHNGTKHPNGYLLDYRHRYDPASQPMLFKVYEDAPRISLPLDPSPKGKSALEAISSTVMADNEERIPDLDGLARILHFSAGITKRMTYPHPWGEILFRAASCTGALYHIELYLVCGELPGLEAGVYHYDPLDSALDLLREGDYRGFLVEASGNDPTLGQAAAVLACTHVSWRNACKYQARAYRHAFWDGGTILSHVLAMACLHDLPTEVVVGFVDDAVSALLGLDRQRELPIALVPIGRTFEETPVPPAEVELLHLEVMPVSDYEMDFSAIREMHEASSLLNREEVEIWRGASGTADESEPCGDLVPLKPFPKGDQSREPLERVILRRGSTRRFAQETITFQQLSTILDRSMRVIPADFLGSGEGFLSQAYLIVNGVEDLHPGVYVLHRDGNQLEELKRGVFRQEAGHLALDQSLGADASVNVYFMAPLREVLSRFGNRGYRAAQLEAGVLAGRMYLAAYAQGLGATGLTFYDDDVTEFFSPHARDRSVMFLIALGIPARRQQL